MYIVTARIFGKYVEFERCDSLAKAIEAGKNLRDYGGWLYVRIVHPNGIIQEVGCIDEEIPIA